MMINQEEKSLVESLHRGDRYACNDLIERFSNQVYNIALRLIGHPTEAEEVWQETFINACRGAQRFEGRAGLNTWLYRIATNNSLMRLRRQEAPTVSLDAPSSEEEQTTWIPQLEDWAWNPETVALSDEFRQAMAEAVAQLPDSLHQVFVLRDLEGLSTKEAAVALGISPSNLKVRLHRARQLLREQLSGYVSETPFLLN